jgi:hypothetical protein
MRIVASACLVLAILFMVGCGTSAEDKKAIQDNTAALTAMKADMAKATTAMTAMQAKIDDIVKFLDNPKSAFGKFTPPAAPAVAPATGAKTPETKTPATKAPEKTKEPGKTK